jgi:Kef-type K+ transport system membrane component KefB
MPEVSFENLLAIAVVAVVAPLLAALAGRLRIPAVVLEIAAGVVLGPSVLGWISIDLPVEIIALLGLGFLLFLAGLEVDVHRLRGRLLRLAALGYLITIALGVAAGTAFAAADRVGAPLLVAIALSATSLGLVVPVLKDAGTADSETGQLVISASSVADFAAVLVLSLLFSMSTQGTGTRLVLLGAFVVTVLVAAAAFTALGRAVRLQGLLTRLQDTTAEIRVRIAVALLIGLVALAERVGLETILGAFMAGAILSFADADEASHPHFRLKLEAIGYGFLIPVFFVTSGLRLDVSALVASPSAFALVPLFLLALLVARGVPAVLYTRSIGAHAAGAAALLQATSLPFIVTAADIGVRIGQLEPAVAAALVTAGLASVLLFPPLALGLLRSAGPSCQEVVELVTDYLEGAMPPPTRAQFEAHAAACHGCQAYLQQIRTTIAVTGSLRAEDIPPAALDTLTRAFRTWNQSG